MPIIYWWKTVDVGDIGSNSQRIIRGRLETKGRKRRNRLGTRVCSLFRPCLEHLQRRRAAKAPRATACGSTRTLIFIPRRDVSKLGNA